MKTVIIGLGEVGQALKAILNPHYLVFTNDIKDQSVYYPDDVGIMHVCFPYSESFIQDVKNYQQKYNPKYTVVHSTVPVGTSSRLNAIHSPIRGLHPNLESGIRTFVKFIGGEHASEVADYFRRVGLRVCLFEKAETTEALKLFDTLQYGISIEIAKEVYKFCQDNSLNFHEVYTLGNQTYNEGYANLGHPEFIRPVLQPIMKKVGGHCILNNAKLLNTEFTKFLNNLNEKY